MGLRVDCLGEFNMFSLLPTSPDPPGALEDRTGAQRVVPAPATSTTRGAEQVRQFHISQVASPNDVVRSWVADDPAAAAGFVDAAKSSGYRYVPVSVRVPRKLPRSGAFKVRTTWRNDGSAPTYDDWRVTLQLRKNGKWSRARPRARPAHRASRHDDFARRSLDLGKLRARPLHAVGDGHRPGRLPCADEPRHRGRAADGAYPIGAVRVARRASH